MPGRDPDGMRRVTVGKLRGLQQLAGRDGIFSMCAMDHRGSMRRLIDPAAPDRVDYGSMVAYKLDLCEALAPVSTAVLLDPVYGAAQAIAAAALPRETGLLVSAEATGYSDIGEGRVTTFLPGWSVEKTRRMGATAAKLLVYYHPDQAATAATQRGVVEQFAEACRLSDLPCLVEAVAYPLGPGRDAGAALAREKARVVATSARDLTQMSVDVLKAEFPGDIRAAPDRGRLLAACQAVDAASQAPWVLLSAAVTFDEFADQVQIACRAGASGFLAGRAVWQEVFAIGGREERRRWLGSVAADRMRRLTAIASEYGRPWWSKGAHEPGATAEVNDLWFSTY